MNQTRKKHYISLKIKSKILIFKNYFENKFNETCQFKSNSMYEKLFMFDILAYWWLHYFPFVRKKKKPFKHLLHYYCLNYGCSKQNNYQIWTLQWLTHQDVIFCFISAEDSFLLKNHFLLLLKQYIDHPRENHALHITVLLYCFAKTKCRKIALTSI